MYCISSQIIFTKVLVHKTHVEKSCVWTQFAETPQSFFSCSLSKLCFYKQKSIYPAFFHFGKTSTMISPFALKFPYLSVEFIELCITSVDVPLILFHFDVHLIDMMGVSTTPPPYHWWDRYLNYLLLTPGGIWYIIYVNIELCIYEYEHVKLQVIIEYGLNEKQRIAKGPQLRCQILQIIFHNFPNNISWQNYHTNITFIHYM